MKVEIRAARSPQDIEEEIMFLRKLAGVEYNPLGKVEVELKPEVAAEVELLRKFGENGLHTLACGNCGREPSRVVLLQLPDGGDQILKLGEREIRGVLVRRCDDC